MPGANRNALQIERRAEFVRMDSIDGERQDAGLVRRRPDEPNTFKGAKCVCREREKV
jgi:hypothetical protein